jgi:zinc transporter, ZIP family
MSEPAVAPRTPDAPRTHRVALAAVVLAIVAVGIAALASLAGVLLPTRTGPPVEQLVVERTVLTAGTIELTVRNTGPDPVTIAQAAVNDSFVAVSGGQAPVGRLATTTLTISYPWQEGLPYAVSLLTSTGAVIEHEIPVAVATPEATPASLARIATLGAMIGIAPVLLGMSCLTLLRRASPATSRILLAFTVGLLAFLAVDATLEGFELGAGAGGAFGGPVLFVLGAVVALLALAALQRVLPSGSGGRRLALLVAIGIGLHNLGEGLAVGSALAVGELALGATLVIGFALHNTTEGIAVVAPLSGHSTGHSTGHSVGVATFIGLGLIAGAPAALGTVLGAMVSTAPQATFLIGLGAGAIVQVIVLLLPSLRDRARGAVDGPVIVGIAAGVVVMYLTGLLVTA